MMRMATIPGLTGTLTIVLGVHQLLATHGTNGLLIGTRLTIMRAGLMHLLTTDPANKERDTKECKKTYCYYSSCCCCCNLPAWWENLSDRIHTILGRGESFILVDLTCHPPTLPRIRCGNSP